MSVDVKQFARTVRWSEEQIRRRLQHCQRQGWAVVIEHTADASAGNRYWDRWGVPLHDPEDPGPALQEINACRTAFPAHYIRVIACEAGRGQATIRHSLLVHSPEGQGNGAG
jgi:ribulose-bisphosphate carboxylase small chain